MASILIADDDPLVRATLASVLEHRGHRTSSVADGATALDVLRKTPETFALFVCDLIMPETEGIETIQQARSRFPYLPILAVSGAGEGSIYLKSARALGASATLLKPFTPEEFLRACDALLSHVTLPA